MVTDCTNKQASSDSSPKGWVSLRLDDIAPLATGSTPSTRVQNNFGDDFPFVSPGDIRDSKYIYSTARRLSKTGFEQCRAFPKGAILFVSIGSTIGKCAVTPELLTANQQINAVLPSETVTPDFLYYALRARGAEIRAQAGEQAVPIVNKSQLGSTLISFPIDKDEQVRIGNALSAADALIDSLEQLLTKKRQIKQGAMQKLFKPVREPLRTVKLEQISGFITKGSTPTTYGFGWEPDGIVFLRNECVSTHGLDLTQSMFISVRAHSALRRSAVSVGDLLMTITGNVGRVVRATIDCNINQHIARIRITDPEINTDFVYHQLSRDEVREELESITTGQAYPQLSLKQVRERTVQIPPRKEQDRTATTLSEMDDEIALLESRLTKARALKQAMAQALLTGRIRLLEPTA